MDRSAVFHTYPALGGPFQSLDDVQSAVVAYACRNSMAMPDELPHKERVIREFLYWPDGTRKVCTRVQTANGEQEKLRRLVEALLDKQNDDKDRADELKDIVHWQAICEGVGKWYYHLNITVKTKGAAADAGSANLFFAEVARDQNHTLGYYISTFFRVNTDSKDDEAICHGCINNGSTDMKHPPAGLFKGGHVDIRFPIGFGPCNDKQWRVSHNTEVEDEELIKEEEERIRDSFDYLEDAVFWENIRHKRLHSRIWESETNMQRMKKGLPLKTEA
uniref:DUF3615 domain-containing protein n=1 Tax=Triticum urartu TaxID=4572 RepID=A0A8R7QMG1_TRIUA